MAEQPLVSVDEILPEAPSDAVIVTSVAPSSLLRMTLNPAFPEAGVGKE